MTNRTGALRSTNSTPPRLRIAVGRKTGAGRLVLESPMTPADRAAHEAASYVHRPVTT
ncbi:hypothetical protein ACFV9E_06355 [Streptomyces sp. NPDC059835]|uniref:hypothetical protein n=1 Tax=Streptomyces sp. NPDC059835 TaxID=3346967 RepID=UPI003669AC48